MEYTKVFIRNIKYISRLKDVTLKRLANDIGVSQAYFSNRRGNKTMYLDVAIRMANYFGMTVNDVIEWGKSNGNNNMCKVQFTDSCH